MIILLIHFSQIVFSEVTECPLSGSILGDRIIADCLDNGIIKGNCYAKAKPGYVLQKAGQNIEYAEISCKQKEAFQVVVHRCVSQSVLNGVYSSHNCLVRDYEDENENHCTVRCENGYHHKQKSTFETSCVYTSDSGTLESILMPKPICSPYECHNPIVNFEEFNGWDGINEYSLTGHHKLVAPENYTFITNNNPDQSTKELDLYCKSNVETNVFTVEIRKIVCQIEIQKGENDPDLIVTNVTSCWTLPNSQNTLYFVTECELNIPEGYAIRTHDEGDLTYLRKTISCFEGSCDVQIIKLVETICFIPVMNINWLKKDMIEFAEKCHFKITKKSVELPSRCKMNSNDHYSIVNKNGQRLKQKEHFCKKENETSKYSLRVEVCNSPENKSTLFFDNLCGVKLVGEECIYRCKNGYQLEDNKTKGTANCTLEAGITEYIFSTPLNCTEIPKNSFETIWFIAIGIIFGAIVIGGLTCYILKRKELFYWKPKHF